LAYDLENLESSNPCTAHMQHLNLKKKYYFEVTFIDHHYPVNDNVHLVGELAIDNPNVLDVRN
jgi:hypothetical protein